MKSRVGIALGAAIWLCPFWLTPTPAVAPLIWGATCLALWLLTEQISTPPAQGMPRLSPPFWLLLLSLASMITWRSRDLPNTLAAALCLGCMGLAAKLSAKLTLNKAVSVIAWGWLLAGLLNSVIGLVQYFGLAAEPLGTAFGLLRQRNQLATQCNIALLSLLFFWRPHSANSSTASHAKHILAAITCALLTAALAATCSRAGLLELVALSFLLLGYALFTRRSSLLFAVLFALGCYVAWACLLPLASGSPETIFARFASMTPQTDDAASMQFQDSRRLLWANTLALIHAQPILGVGWRELANALSTSDFGSIARFSAQADNAHNLPLQFAAELGLPFAALWLGLLAWLVVHRRPWLDRTPEQVLAWGVLAVIGIHSLLEYPMWYAPFQLASAFSMGILFVQVKPAVPRHGNAVASLIGYGLAGIGLLWFCAYAAFDYHRVRQLFLASDERSVLYREGTYAKAQASWLFASQVRFAKLTTTPATNENASELWQLGHQVLHFSPEPLVFQALIDAGEFLATSDSKVAIELAALQKQLQLIERSRSESLPPLK